MADVELRRLVGETFDARLQRNVRIGRDMDLLLLHGKQIATISHRPGAAIQLMSGVWLLPDERKAVEETVAAARGGVKPASIGAPVNPAFEYLDDELGEE